MSVTLKCVHSEGVGHLRYTSDGAHLLTAGADALVKVFDVAAGGVNSNEPKTVEHPNETVVSTLAMHPKGKGFVTGADSNQVTQFSFPGGEVEKVVLRASCAIRHVEYDAKGRYLAAGLDDGVIKFGFLAMGQFTPLKAHGDSVLSLAFDPQGRYLASTSADGTCRVWDLEADTPEVVKVVQLSGRIAPGSPQRLRAAWHPSGGSLAVPHGAAVHVLERETWEVQSVLRGAHSKEVSLISWCDNGRYLASGGLDRQLFVWDLSTAETLDRYKAEVRAPSRSRPSRLRRSRAAHHRPPPRLAGGLLRPGVVAARQHGVVHRRGGPARHVAEARAHPPPLARRRR
jgi:chromosome transmission fidelity protein 4